MSAVVIVSSTVSDAHTWNLVFLQLLVEEVGLPVVNLGPCVPEELLAAECLLREPALVVISSVNGHGYQDCLGLIRRLRAADQPEGMLVVAGGKLAVLAEGATRRAEHLRRAGFDAVFDDGPDSLVTFRQMLVTLTGEGHRTRGVPSELSAGRTP